MSNNMAELARLIHLANFLSNMDERMVQERQLQQLQSIQRGNLIHPQPLLNNLHLRPNLLGGGVGRTYRNTLNNNNVNQIPGLLPNPLLPNLGPANLPQFQPRMMNTFLSIQCPHCNFIQTSRNFHCSQANCRRLMYVTFNGRSEKCSNCYFPRSCMNFNACPLCFSNYNESGIISLPGRSRSTDEETESTASNEQAPNLEAAADVDEEIQN